MNKKQMMKGHWTVNYNGSQSFMALGTFIKSWLDCTIEQCPNFLPIIVFNRRNNISLGNIVES